MVNVKMYGVLNVVKVKTNIVNPANPQTCRGFFSGALEPFHIYPGPACSPKTP